MRIAVVGAGAVGGYFGAQFMDAGADVVFVARGETLKVLRTTGLTVRSPQGERTLSVNAVGSLDEVEHCDIVFWATKSLAAPFLPEALPDGAVLVTTQNSVEMPAIAVDSFGADRVIPGVVRSFLIHDGPGIARYTGGVLSFTFGQVHSATAQVADAFGEMLAATDIDPIRTDNILGDVWAKAMFVTCFGALGALLGTTLEPVRTTYRTQLTHLMEEAFAIAQASGVDVPEDLVQRSLDFTDAQPGESTTSMQRDIASGQPHELDAQVGAIIRMGERVGVQAKLHQLVNAALVQRSLQP